MANLTLGSLVRGLKIPQFKQLQNEADGVITLRHQRILMSTPSGIRPRETSRVQFEYLAFLGLIRDYPDKTFDQLFLNAIETYEFPSDPQYAAQIADQYRRNLAFFTAMGALKTQDEQLFSEEPLSPMHRYALNAEGLENIDVVHVESAQKDREFDFLRYFNY